MSSQQRIRHQQLIRHAEGYLELGMASHALATLDQLGDGKSLAGSAAYLRGEALRSLERYDEALAPLRQAAAALPENVPAWLALGWCYKRLNRIDLAIDSLEKALAIEPDEALLHYNLACYWSLAANKRQALMFLSRALTLNPEFRDQVGAESDFDNVRAEPAFKALTSVIV